MRVHKELEFLANSTERSTAGFQKLAKEAIDRFFAQGQGHDAAAAGAEKMVR